MSKIRIITLYFPFLIILVASATFFSCKKSKVDDPIPNVPVNQTIYLSLPQYSALNSPGNYVIITGGYRGIVVYRKDLTQYVAFDLACPYDPTATGAKLEVDSSGITTVDAHCGSKFSLIDGSVIHGPATRSMKAYTAEYNSSDNAVYIYN